LQARLEELRKMLALPPAQRESSARRIAQSLVLVAQGVLMVRQSDPVCADAFVATRLADGAGHCGRVYGTLPSSDVNWHRQVVLRAMPEVVSEVTA
jgi:putative acyl-CoA dehydrogenase